MERDFDALWDFNDPAGTEEKLRTALRERTDHSAEYRLELLTQIARTLGLQRKFEEAHSVLDEVERELGPGMDRVRVRYLLERGRAFNSSRQPEKARPLFLEAWELGQKCAEDALAVDAAHMMGIVEPPEEQLAWNERAIELAARSSEPRARNWLASLYNNTGWTYHDKGDHQKALDLFQKAHAERERQGNTGTIQIARWCVARCLRSLGRHHEALEMQLVLLEEKKGQGDGFVHEELGELLLIQERPDEARPHFAAAYELLSQDAWLTEGEPERIRRLKVLAGL